MTRPQLWVIAGPNGAGKSTLADRFVLDLIVVVNPDTIARKLPRTPDGQLAQGDAGKIASRQRTEYLQSRRSFAFETTLSGRGELKLMRDAAELGFKVNLVFVGIPNPQHSAARVRERVRRGGHDVPVDDTDRRYPRSMANLPDAMAIADRTYIFDNSSLRHHLLLVREHGRIRIVATSLPRWLRAALPDLDG